MDFIKFVKHALIKDKALGVSERHHYDIPLDRGSGRYFLTILIALMVFLALLSVSAAFILAQFANRWETGLEGRWSVELPAVDERGELISRNTLDEQTQEIIARLSNLPIVIEIKLLPENEIKKLLEPWFDTDHDPGLKEEEENSRINNISSIPLPTLLSLEMKSTSQSDALMVQNALKKVTASARLDRHEEWLGALLRLTGTLRMVAFLFTLIICAAGIVAIAGAMQTRMAEHKDSIELLHLMGASDNYITRQFQRHALIISMQGAIAGLISSALFLFILNHILSDQSKMFLPEFKVTFLFCFMFIIVVSAAILFSTLTTRFTVLRAIQRML